MKNINTFLLSVCFLSTNVNFRCVTSTEGAHRKRDSLTTLERRAKRVPYVTEGLNKHDIEPMFTTFCTLRRSTKDFKTFDYKFSNRHFCQIQTKLLQEAACKKLLLALGKCYA